MRIDMSNGAIETIPNEKVLASIGDHIDNPIPDPPTPKLAATVMLVRDSKPGQTKYRIDDGVFPPDFPNNQNVEVFMLRRVNTMDFLPDAVVFPGGRVDERDSNPDLPWCGPSPKDWAELLGVSEDDARRIVVAAAPRSVRGVRRPARWPRCNFYGDRSFRPELGCESRGARRARDRLCRPARRAQLDPAYRLARSGCELLHAHLRTEALRYLLLLSAYARRPARRR